MRYNKYKSKVWKILESKDKEHDLHSGVGNTAHPNQSIKNVNRVLGGRDTVLLKFRYNLTNKKQHLTHSCLIKTLQITAQSYIIKTSKSNFVYLEYYNRSTILYSQIR